MDDQVNVAITADTSDLEAGMQRVGQAVQDSFGTIGNAAEEANERLNAMAGESEESLNHLGVEVPKFLTAALKPIGHSLTAALTGMVMGTETWQKAMERVFSTMASEFIGDVLSMMAQWAAFEALGLGTNPLTGGGLGGFIGGLFGIGGGAGAAAVAGGGGLSDAAVTAPFALGLFDVGAWNVPQDMIAMVHAGEMILPPEQAALARNGVGVAPFPAGTSGAGSGVTSPAATAGGGITVNFNVSALDGQSVAALLKNQGSTLAAVIAGQIRNGSTALRGALTPS